MKTWYVVERFDGSTHYTPCRNIFDANTLFCKIFQAGGKAWITNFVAVRT